MKVQDLHSFKQKALQWANTFHIAACYDSNGYSDSYGKYDLLLAVGDSARLSVNSDQAFDKLKSFYEQHQNWIFGLLSYDLKNDVENLHSGNADHLLFPDLFFFVPQYLILIKDNEIEIAIGSDDILGLIDEMTVTDHTISPIDIKSKISRETYINTVKELQQHIVRGDIYEVNFCQEFFAEHAHIAEGLFAALCSQASAAEAVYLDLPEVNAAAVALAQRHDMRVVFETARMYTGRPPAVNMQGLYGITSFELG